MTRIAVVHKVTWTREEWLRLEALGDVSYSPSLPSGEEELLARIDDAQIVVSATIVPFTGRVIEGSAALRLLAVLSTGCNNVDLSAARRCGVTVTNVPGYSAHSVAEHAWAMVLHLAKRLGQADAHVRRREFDWSAIEGLQIHGLTAGIIGTGHIGARLAAIAAGLGCRVLAFTQHPSPERARTLGVTFVELSELLAQSDIILVHAALDAGTRGLLNRAAFQAMARRPNRPMGRTAHSLVFWRLPTLPLVAWHAIESQADFDTLEQRVWWEDSGTVEYYATARNEDYFPSDVSHSGYIHESFHIFLPDLLAVGSCLENADRIEKLRR